MRHRVERTRCPVCRNNDTLRPICTGCKGAGEAIVVHHPNGVQIEIHPIQDEEMLRLMYPDAETPVHVRTTLVQAYINFITMVGLSGASVLQRREMRRAFYAGAHWMLEMCAAQLDPSSEPTADDLEYLQRITAEIDQFNIDIQQGRV